MEELDLLKKDWQKLDNFNQVSEQDIYGMLQKKSSSIVKWILIISILEFLLWAILNIFFKIDDYFIQIKHPEFIYYSDLITYLSYLVIFIFIIFLYKNYKKISTTVSTKQLMNDILKTRKTVQLYVYYNLIMIVISCIFSVYLSFAYNPELAIYNSKILNNPKILIIGIVVTVLFSAIFLFVFWLFYKLLYGILLKKLYANYKELKKIDL